MPSLRRRDGAYSNGWYYEATVHGYRPKLVFTPIAGNRGQTSAWRWNVRTRVPSVEHSSLSPRTGLSFATIQSAPLSHWQSGPRDHARVPFALLWHVHFRGSRLHHGGPVDPAR